MSKKKALQNRRDAAPIPSKAADAPAPVPSKTVAPAPVSRFVVFRETIESIVVAFVLAFLFRTFEAEAFVIPTGSMSPSLQGRHKDVACTQCGARFRTSASSEDPEDLGRRGPFRTFEEAEVVGGMCPMCRYPMPYTADLPREAIAEVESLAIPDQIEKQTSYPGDRILVNKYGFDFGEPQRWDVVVFKFPGDGEMNYIKRLVGLPGEKLQVFQGDVFTGPLDDPSPTFKIERKPADKVDAMLQLVHDTDFEPSTLYRGKWPLRWDATTPDGWQIEAEPGELTVAQEFTVDLPAEAPTAWLRYRHQIPDAVDWAAAIEIARTGSLKSLADREGVSIEEAERARANSIHPQLITDFNSYNARIHRLQLLRGFSWSTIMDDHLGKNWVGDLAVEADVDVQEARGELLLDLVEAGYHFRLTVDLTDGTARLAIIDGRTGEALPFEAEAKTPIAGVGKYNVRLANVDDQLLLWVDGKQVEFVDSTYDPEELFAETGGRRGMIPWANVDGGDHGDLAPVGVGANGAKLAISRLRVLRDVYYIAARDDMPGDWITHDYDLPLADRMIEGERAPALRNTRDLMTQPEAWAWFRTRRDVTFPIQAHQLFVMGDNSPESADCRLWTKNEGRGVPGGRYLDRRLLIGKAVCVFWPHSWGGIPGLDKLPGFPNFGDMRLVK